MLGYMYRWISKRNIKLTATVYFILVVNTLLYFGKPRWKRVDLDLNNRGNVPLRIDLTRNEGAALPEKNSTKITIPIIPQKTFNEYTNSSQIGKQWFQFPGLIIYGNERKQKGFLSIAVPFVSQDIKFLMQTVQSIINNTSNAEKQRITIMIYLSSIKNPNHDIKINTDVTRVIADKYKDHLQSGFITMFHNINYTLCSSGHQDMHCLPTTTRMLQVADISTMLKISQEMNNTYYLQLEAGVHCQPQFISAIERFIDINSKTSWTALDFTKTGFIGKLFQERDIHKLVSLMETFYKQQTVEELFHTFQELLSHKLKTVYHKPLFLFRSKRSEYIDYSRFSKTVDRTKNPTAFVSSTIYGMNLDLFYSHSSTSDQALWIVKGDEIFIIFNKTQTIEGINVHSGDKKKRPGRYLVASVSVGTGVHTYDLNNNILDCKERKVIGNTDAKKGKITLVPNRDVKCIVITVTKTHHYTVLLQNITIDVKL